MIALTLAFRNVLRRRERSLLTLVGVLLAVGAFVAMVSLAEGLYRRVSLELDGRAVDIYVVPRTAAPLPTGPVGTVGLTTDTVALTWIEKIAALKNVRRVAPITRDQWTSEHGTVMVVGIEPTSLREFLPSLEIVEGRVFEAGQILVGVGLAASEGLTPGSSQSADTGLKNRFGPGETRYPISGLVSSGSGFQDYFVYLPLATALETNARKGVQEVWVKVEDPHRVAEVVQAIKSLGIPDVKVMTRKDYLGAASDYIEYAWLLQFAISAIGVLIAITAAMNTMLMSTYERMREFGTLRAIGAPTRDGGDHGGDRIGPALPAWRHPGPCLRVDRFGPAGPGHGHPASTLVPPGSHHPRPDRPGHPPVPVRRPGGSGHPVRPGLAGRHRARFEVELT